MAAFNEFPRKWANSAWPDPIAPEPTVDDVTRLNATSVDRIFYVRCKEDILSVLDEANQTGKSISVRGTKHSMGGHSIAKGGLVLDMTKFCEMSYDSKNSLFTTTPGVTWAQAISYLNEFSASPRTMQSYASFSIGGTLSVNAHGITTDFCLAESVVSFSIFLADGTDVTCDRANNAELFGLAIGGYGLFGIIHQITMKVNPNCRLDMESIHCTVKDFPQLYRGIQNSPDVEIKIARLDITNAEEIDLYVFRRASPPTVSLLPLQVILD